MIEGSYYEGTSSKRYACQLSVNELGMVSLSGVEFEPCRFDSLRISSRVGNTARVIRFVNNGRFETLNNDAVDQLSAEHGKSNSWFVAYHWESKLKLIVVAAVVTVALLLGFVKVGLPAASKSIAHRLPAYVSVSLAENVLEELDDVYFEKSKLSEQQQIHITGLFENLIPPHSDINYSLKFRDSETFGANAFAVPDGTIVVTDDLVKLADSDEELIAVMLHEVGHIVHRHSLRNMVEAAGLYALYSWVTGDVEVTSTVLLTLSALLLKAEYSREHESEADAYSLASMLESDINPHYFPIIMRKMVASARLTNKDEQDESEYDKEPKADNAQENDHYVVTILDYLSSHPPTKERNKRFTEAATANGYPLILRDEK